MAISQGRSRRWRLLLLVLPLLGFPFLLQQVAQEEGQSLFLQPKETQALIQQAISGTYQINCFDDWVGSGWGVKIDDEYYVVTAFHVVEDCVEDREIQARNTSTEIFQLELVAYDGRFWSSRFDLRDLALLKASGQINILNTAKELPSIGHWVAVIGYPFDSNDRARLSYTQGAVSSYDSRGLIVTDAAINGGNSGGPLINSRGEVVGTVFASDPTEDYENMGFAQGLLLHCGLAFQCSGGVPVMALPDNLIKVSED